MSEATLRAAIYSVVNGVTDVGIVHDYERWANEWTDFLNLFRTEIDGEQVIRGWEVVYRGFPDASERMQMQDIYPAFLRPHRFLVAGYLQSDDSEESEKTAAALAETVADALNTDATLLGLVHDRVEPTLIFEPRTFGGVLCHYAEIVLTLWEFKT